MALRNVTAALADYEKLAEAHPDFAFGHHFRGRGLTEQKQFDEAIKIGDVRGGAYREALEGKRKLGQP